MLKHGEEVTFSFAVSLGQLLELGSMDNLNDYMDDQFVEQFDDDDATLVDLKYRPVGVDNMDDIMIEVTGTVERMS